MSELFTAPEINLMCVFDASGRNALIAELTAAITGFDEPELIEIAESVLKKLGVMSDEGFSALELYPEYEDYDEESEV
jgi:hypothetical protein